MRSIQVIGISFCAVLASLFGCSSSDENTGHDGSPDLIELADRPAMPDTDKPVDTSPDLIELADRPAMPDTDKPVDTSPDLIELVDKPLPIDGQTPTPDGAIDGSPIDGAPVDVTTLDGTVAGETRDNPCGACAANQVCVQANDGICHTTVACKTVSAACRSKLAASGAKSCTSLSECESELCSQPYRCIYNIPCGNELPEVALYCYGP